jgi:hypothetical protein
LRVCEAFAFERPSLSIAHLRYLLSLSSTYTPNVYIYIVGMLHLGVSIKFFVR